VLSLFVVFVFVLFTCTVSSSEEQSTQVDTMQTGGIMAHWWHVDATPSTSSERDGSSAGSSGVGKRPRDDSRTYVPTDSVNACPVIRVIKVTDNIIIV